MTSCTYHAKAKANALSKYSRVSVLVSVVSVRDTANMEKVEKEDITHQDRTPQEELIYLIRLQGVLLGCTHPHQDKCPQDSTLPVSTRRQCLEHILLDPIHRHLIHPLDLLQDQDTHQIQVKMFLTSCMLDLV